MDVKNDLSGGKPTLLIAEDEESNYLLLKTILHKYCNLIRAKTGLEALALFKENEVDLILMDIKMPEMTGIESLKEIRKLSKDIPVIMQSAYVFDSDMEAAKEAGASGFITKPINLKVLKNTIACIISLSNYLAICLKAGMILFLLYTYIRLPFFFLRCIRLRNISSSGSLPLGDIGMSKSEPIELVISLLSVCCFV